MPKFEVTVTRVYTFTVEAADSGAAEAAAYEVPFKEMKDEGEEHDASEIAEDAAVEWSYDEGTEEVTDLRPQSFPVPLPEK